MKKDITLEAKTMSREQFINDITETVFCPSYYNLENHRQCSTYICKECWERALKDVEFKGEQ